MLRILIGLLFWTALAGPVAARDLPPPTAPAPEGASPELREIIRNLPSRKIGAAPATHAEWTSTIKRVDESDLAKTLQILDQSDVELTTDQVADVDVHRITPKSVLESNEDRLFLYLHGGAYVFGRGEAGIGEAVLIAHRIGIPVISVDYRMPPEHPFPAAIDDVVAVYERLLESRSPESIIIGGTSAGGGLALAAVYRFRNLGLPLPGAIYAGTPWADLTKTGDTLYTNEGLDRILTTYDGTLAAAARLYADDQDLKDPLISPVYGDFEKFPPTLFVTGTRDMFLSDTARAHRKMRAAGVQADLHVFEGLSHAGYWISPGTPESRETYRELAAFIDRHLD